MPTIWDERYAGDEYLFGEAPNAFLAAQAGRLSRGWRALAIADGEGRNGVWLAEQGLVVDSVDSSAVAQGKARKLAAKRGVAINLQLADIAGFAWRDETYDLVAGIFFQFADPDLRARIFAGMQRALRPGGLLLIEGYRPEQLAYGTGGPRQVDKLYTEAMLREAFAAMQIVSLECYDADLTEGRHHAGMSALIDLVAVKPSPSSDR